MKRKSKAISACFTLMCVCAGLTSCGNSGEISAEIPESSSKAEMSATQETEAEIQAEQSSEAEDTTVEETTEAPTSAETTVVATIPIEDRMPKTNQITKVEYEAGMEFEYHYCFVPEEATVISDDINLGLITVDGKEFDITELSNAYGEEEIQSIFGEQAGLYTTDRLIADGVFEDVYIVEKRSPHRDKFLFGENRGDESVEVGVDLYGLTKSKGAYDFINVEYVNGWFKGFHTKCLAMNNPTNDAIEQINGKAFVEENSSAQFTANNDKLITYTDKNIAVGDGTTLGDLTTIFGAEPTYADDDLGSGVIYTYRNSTVTVGFVRGTAETKPELANKHGLSEEEQKSIPIVAIYMWLND